MLLPLTLWMPRRLEMRVAGEATDDNHISVEPGAPAES
jgi:hypothetical protein